MSTTDLISHLRDVQSAIEAYGCDALKNHPAVVSIDTAINCALSDEGTRPPKGRQRPVLEAIEELWAHVPEWRFGQLLYNITPQNVTVSMFYLRDEDLCRWLGQELDRRNGRR